MGAMQMEPEPRKEGAQSHAEAYAQHYAVYGYGQSVAAQVDPATTIYAQADAESRAATLAAEMMDDSLRGQPISGVATYLAPQVSLSDVATDVDQFADQCNYCSENNISIPCIEDNKSEPLPINLASVVHAFVDPTAYQDPSVARLLLQHLPQQVSALTESSRITYSHYSPDDARHFFGERLRRFLLPRLGSEPPSVGKPALHQGLLYKVHTDTYGLRIYYTPAYWFSPNQVFGSPTSPVEGWIMPGRYKFGAAGASYRLKFDEGEFNIPPSTEAHLEI